MSKWYCGLFAAMVCLVAAGCAQQAATVTPADAAAMVQSGRALLSCRDACLAEWRRVQPEAAQLDAAARWPELAAAVLRVGYEDDLSLYYLGRVAEGLGYPGAAASYYRQSLRLSGTSAACQYLSRTCGGVALPRAAGVRLASIERQLYSPVRRRGTPGPGRPGTLAEPAGETAAPEPIEAAGPALPAAGPPVAEPSAPSAAPMSAPPPPSPPVARRVPSASEFIEPPAR